jgi:hypothetical protein
VRISSYLTDEELAAMSAAELESWWEAQAIGPWTPNEPASPAPRTASVTIPLRPEVAAELEAEAALHRQAYPRYAADLLLLALRIVQAARRGRA